MDPTRSGPTHDDHHHVTLSLQAALEGLFTCVACQDALHLPSPRLFRDHQFRVQCHCGMIHDILIGSRRYARKGTALPGRYGGLAKTAQEGDMTVEDLSFGGIGFRALEAHTIQRGDRLRLAFTLDDETQSAVEVVVRVRNVREDAIGVEFLPSDDFNRVLATYLIR